MLAPNWLGISGPNLEQAKLVAGSKYVAFVADMYGKDGRPKGIEDAPKLAGGVRGDPKLMRARVSGALETLKAQKVPGGLDMKKLGAVGFCFGGTGVLELARGGADVLGVVSFHGGLAPLMRAMARTVCPAATSARISSRPTKPDPPVTKQRMA